MPATNQETSPMTQEITMTPSITAAGLYAGLHTLIGLWLVIVVSQWRARTKVWIGDGGNADLFRAMRGQANFVENVPLTLILLLVMAMFGTPAFVIHLFGISLLIARILHGMHFAAPGRPSWQRATGATLTILVQLATAIGVIGHAVRVLV